MSKDITRQYGVVAFQVSIYVSGKTSKKLVPFIDQHWKSNPTQLEKLRSKMMEAAGEAFDEIIKGL